MRKELQDLLQTLSGEEKLDLVRSLLDAADPDAQQYNEFGLNPQQYAFCRNYLESFNAKQAAIEAGYSEAYARSAYRWVRDHDRHPKTAGFIAKALKLRGGVNEGEVMGELRELAFASIEDFLDIPDTPNPALPFAINMAKGKKRGVLRAIKKVRYTSQTIEFEMYDKIKALDLLASILGMKKEISINADWKDVARQMGLEDQIEQLEEQLQREKEVYKEAVLNREWVVNE